MGLATMSMAVPRGGAVIRWAKGMRHGTKGDSSIIHGVALPAVLQPAFRKKKKSAMYLGYISKSVHAHIVLFLMAAFLFEYEWAS